MRTRTRRRLCMCTSSGRPRWQDALGGISKRSYPNVDIKNLTRVQAINIYRRDFWHRIHGDGMFGSVAYQSMDFAVNSGMMTAIRCL